MLGKLSSGTNLPAATVIIALSLSALSASNASVVDQAQVDTAIANGAAYLVTQQAADGCWTSDGVTTGVTALAMLAIINAVPGGYAGLPPATKTVIDKGTACLLNHVITSGPAAGTIDDGPFDLSTYNTSTAIWALSEVPPTPAITSAISGGRTWILANQANFGDGRADLGGNVNNGGWYYEGGLTPSFLEHSNSSFALQALAATGGIPPATATLAQGFWTCLQRVPANAPAAPCSAGGGPFADGGFIYSHQLTKGGTETSATGSGSFAFSLTGVAASDPRIVATLAYLDESLNVNACDNLTHTVDSLGSGWTGTSTLIHYAEWANFKAHELAGVAPDLTDPSNYFSKLASCIVLEQMMDGSVPASGREDNDLSTSFGMLTLEKVTPTPPQVAKGAPTLSPVMLLILGLALATAGLGAIQTRLRKTD